MTEEQYIEVREINRKLMIAVDLINKLQVDVKNLNISGYEDEILEFFKKQREKYETKMARSLGYCEDFYCINRMKIMLLEKRKKEKEQ